MSLIDELYKVQELSKVLEELGHDEVILRILDDTSTDRAGGAANYTAPLKAR